MWALTTREACSPIDGIRGPHWLPAAGRWRAAGHAGTRAPVAAIPTICPLWPPWVSHLCQSALYPCPRQGPCSCALPGTTLHSLDISQAQFPATPCLETGEDAHPPNQGPAEKDAGAAAKPRAWEPCGHWPWGRHHSAVCYMGTDVPSECWPGSPPGLSP